MQQTGGAFKFALFYNNLPVGYLDLDGKGWCIKSEEGQLFETFIENSRTYLRVWDGEWAGSFLAVHNDGTVGAYRESVKQAWELRNDSLICLDDESQPLSFKEDEDYPYVYANAARGYSIYGVVQE